jgi:hypothetical protein
LNLCCLVRLFLPGDICPHWQRKHLFTTEPDSKIARKHSGSILTGHYDERRTRAARKGCRHKQGARRERHGNSCVTASLKLGICAFKRSAREQCLGK